MLHSLASSFAHLDATLFIFAGIMAFVSGGGSTVMLGFERYAEEARKEFVRALAGACFGGGAWASYILCILALQPAVMLGFGFTLSMTAGALAVSGAAFTFAKFGISDTWSWRRPIILAVLSALCLAIMHFVGMGSIQAAAHISGRWDVLAVAATELAIVSVAHQFVIRHSVVRANRLASVVVYCLALLCFCALSASSISLNFDPSMAAPETGFPPLVLAFLVCVIAAGLLVSALGLVIIDRGYALARLTADSMASKLADAALEGLIVHDGVKVIEANARFSWLASDGTEAVQGQPLSDFFDEAALLEIRQTLQQGGEGVFETSLLGANAEVEICTRLYDLDQGQYVTAVRDISMRRRIDSAERANLAKSQFLANMSHELRTPLNAIIGYSEMIVEDSDDKGAIHDAGEINKAAKNMMALVSDIVDLSRIEDGKIDFCFDLCDFSEMADRLQKRFGEQAQAQRLSLAFDVEPTTSNCIIDEKRVEQCIAQLMSNAIKFTEKGGVLVRIYAEADELKITVRDTGIGICPARATELFDAYSQGDGSITRRYGGVGVGLALTSRLVAMMGGRLELQTAEGKGAAFTLIVPSDPDPDMLALCRRAGTHARVIKVIEFEQDKAA